MNQLYYTILTRRIRGFCALKKLVFLRAVVLLSIWFTLDGIIMNHTKGKQRLGSHGVQYFLGIIRLDLCNGLRREVAGKAMPFGRVP